MPSEANWLVAYPILDVAAFALWLWWSVDAWRGMPNETPTASVAERQLGAQVILSQLTGVLTASSIIIVGAGAFAALRPAGAGGSLSAHLIISAIHAIVALAIAVLTMGAIPHRVSNNNVVRSKPVAVMCSLSLCLVVLAGFRLMLGVVSIVG